MVDATATTLPLGYRTATQAEAYALELGPYDLERRYCIDHAAIGQSVVRGDLTASRVVDYAKSRGWCVTIDDIKKMSVGDCLDVALMDRNWMDVACEDRPDPMPAREFLRRNRVRFCKSGAFVGAFTPHDKDGGTFGDSLTTELHVEYAPLQFFPLFNGVLPAKDPQTDRALLGTRIAADEMNDRTLVGWRGPMIRWDRLEHMPEILCF